MLAMLSVISIAIICKVIISIVIVFKSEESLPNDTFSLNRLSVILLIVVASSNGTA